MNHRGDGADDEARARAEGEAADHRGHERGVVGEEGRGGQKGDLDEGEQRGDGAHERHGNELACAPAVRVLEFDLLGCLCG